MGKAANSAQGSSAHEAESALRSIIYLLRKMDAKRLNHVLWYCQRVQ